MTFAVSIKVNDGLVLAADSAATLVRSDGQVAYVFNNANKIVNLLKGSPIGIVSWGAGAIGNMGLELLLKDLRARFAGRDSSHTDWKLDPENYEVSVVADRVRAFLFEEVYSSVYPRGVQGPALGCIVAGYSSGQLMADQFEVDILGDGSCPPPFRLTPREDSPSILWAGQPEAVQRLIHGYDAGLGDLLAKRFSLATDELDEVLRDFAMNLNRHLAVSAMPIRDAIELAEFLVDLTIKYTHFLPDASTVGPPIEVAAITKHEGFKWIRRKYYYSRELNPEEVASG